MAAARAEIGKIELRHAELDNTLATLRAEAVHFERRLPRLEAQAGDLSGQIEQIVAPNLNLTRSNRIERGNDLAGSVSVPYTSFMRPSRRASL
ncbi:hypothetical protein [Phenylobacterium sp.]|uniref:hypothetical protein n=1 Tax=Phenylobacterium sp. TaxID=1871053 RepID=UPI002E31DD3C|nr:hypothetical protein [Phenylobacterium sp.]HEX3364506.1 hypothetical protein [Phenylobacterium sp.]